MHVIAPFIGKVALLQKPFIPQDKKSPGTRNPLGQEIPGTRNPPGQGIPRDKNPPGNPGQELLVEKIKSKNYFPSVVDGGGKDDVCKLNTLEQRYTHFRL